MTMSGKELVKLLIKNGWSIDRIHGSHYIMVKGNQMLSVPVHGNKPLGAGILKVLLKQAGLE